MLTCTVCKEVKPTAEFRKRSDITRGYQYPCKACTTPEKRNSHQIWEKSILHKFDLTAGDYFSLLESQGGCCALCGDSECQTGKRFAVDHCHSTGKVRGILCYNCNTGLGKFRDNPDVLSKAIHYLKGV